MTCQGAQALILEGLDRRLDAEQQISLDAHIARCDVCQSFQESQQALDEALATHCVAPQLSAGFRSELAHKIRAEKRRAFQEWVPDLLHLGGGILATGACMLWMPFSAGVVLTIGIALTSVSYVLQTMFRFWLEDLEGL
jgi:hypothetical protein